MLFRLQDEAPAAGGAVHLLMGNHELLSSMGAIHYAAGSNPRQAEHYGLSFEALNFAGPLLPPPPAGRPGPPPTCGAPLRPKPKKSSRPSPSGRRRPPPARAAASRPHRGLPADAGAQPPPLRRRRCRRRCLCARAPRRPPLCPAVDGHGGARPARRRRRGARRPQRCGGGGAVGGRPPGCGRRGGAVARPGRVGAHVGRAATVGAGRVPPRRAAAVTRRVVAGHWPHHPGWGHHAPLWRPRVVCGRWHEPRDGGGEPAALEFGRAPGGRGMEAPRVLHAGDIWARAEVGVAAGGGSRAAGG
ncbi:hypothetical protein BU14_0442s0003 [Porphyra umbilicalis]|uniref:Uncharacterized protein n=1 Tax=Porphyra umbilicalis TaxID=2786 RepID=A0A1X6NUS3_PORUM|nr:hypothetical protein BU14_0442s0003 [Porphyra umbilicalis]|eukprot:OSX72368.1 hypothetical protein BU14_0442s0003 [Porphyra umbilicalis]